MTKIVQTLDSWTKAATKGLPPSVQQRIATEIEDHFTEARQRYLAEGKSSEEATSAAISHLGNAHEVSGSFRDAHFSRSQYSFGRVAVITLLAMLGITIILSGLSYRIDLAHEVNYISTWFVQWQILADLGNGILLLVISHSILVFLKEQFEIRPPRWGWYLFTACVLVSAGASMLNSTYHWLDTYGWQTKLSILMTQFLASRITLRYFLSHSLFTVAILGELAYSILMVTFCVRQYITRTLHSPRILSAFWVTSSIVSGALVLFNGGSLAQPSVQLAIYQLFPSIRPLLFVIVLAFAFFYIGLLATTFRIFSIMRRSGMVITK